MGYSDPEFVTLEERDDESVISYLEDLGPHLVHNYEIVNLGPQTIHNAQVGNNSVNSLQIYIPYIYNYMHFWKPNILKLFSGSNSVGD